MTSLLSQHLPKDIVNIIQQMLMISEEEVRKNHRLLMKDIKSLCVCTECFSTNCSAGHLCPICYDACERCHKCGLYLCVHYMILVSNL